MPANKPPFDGERVKLGELISKAPIERCGDGKYPVYSMTMRDGIVEQAGRFKKTIASKDTSSYKVVKKNQLVVGFPIDEGVIYVQHHDVPGIMSPAYNVWNINLGRVDPSYLEFALHSPRSMAYYADKMRGTTARRRTLTADGLREMEILLPSVDEQVRVVNTLDEVRSLIKEANGQIAMLDTLVKSRFVEMFGGSGWPVATVGSLATDIRYGTSKKASDCGQFVYLRMNNMTDGGGLDFGDVKHIDLSGAELEKCQVVDGDLLFNRTNSREKVGKTAVFHAKEPMVIAGYIIRVRLGDRIKPDFLAAYMNLPTTKAMLRSIARGAVHQANINSRELSAIEVPVPPICLQDSFLSFVAEVDKSRFNLLKAYGSIIALFRVLFP